MCYFAGRSAAMGAVGSGVVTATFHNFHPGWSPTASRGLEAGRPEAVLAARRAAADEGAVPPARAGGHRLR